MGKCVFWSKSLTRALYMVKIMESNLLMSHQTMTIRHCFRRRGIIACLGYFSRVQ